MQRKKEEQPMYSAMILPRTSEQMLAGIVHSELQIPQSD